MAMSADFETCMGKLYELYMEGRVNDESTKWYLSRLEHKTGERVFGKQDVDKLLSRLIEDKEGRRDHSTEEEDYMLKHIKTARTRDDLDLFEEAVLSLREGYVETDAVEGISVQDERLEAIQKKRGERRW